MEILKKYIYIIARLESNELPALSLTELLLNVDVPGAPGPLFLKPDPIR
jgi:hypothetical protein